MEVHTSFEELTKWLLGALGAVFSAWVIRRRISVESLATRKNDGEAAWLTQLQRERDECFARERETNLSMTKLHLEKAVLQEKVDNMTRDMARIRRLLGRDRPDLVRLIDSDFGLLDEPPP